MKNIKLQITNNKSILYSLFVFLYFTHLAFGQFDIPEKPSFQTSVYDYANILNESEKQEFERKLIQYSDSTTTQIVFISIESLKGENIGLLAPKWGHAWGIGQKNEDNGVIVLLAKNERKIWISPGYGVEDRLTAGITGEIIRDIIIPEFKAGNYYTGLNNGTDAIFEVLKGKYKGTRKSDEIPLGTILFFIFLFIVLLIIFSKNNRGKGGGFSSGPDLGDIIILSRMGRGGGGWSSGESSWGGGGSGGFGGGFGGGGFSGGGAGGDW